MSTQRCHLEVVQRGERAVLVISAGQLTCEGSSLLCAWLTRPVERAIALRHCVPVRTLNRTTGAETLQAVPLDLADASFPEALRSYVASLLPGLAVTIVEPAATIPRRDRVRSRLASLLAEPEVTSAAEQALQVIDQLDEQAIQALDDLTSQREKP